ncbi:MAG: Clp protease ClpP [Muribaculaceae bacterium]|nr:Clp protease ClpP [Muribaculaceae bacterium]
MPHQLKLKGFVGGWDFDSDYTDYILDKYAGQPVSVCIDSLGGQINTGLSISASFKNHGDVTVHFVGMNASAATIASLGAKRITMDADAFYLVHKSSFNIVEWTSMNEDQIEDFIKSLEHKKEQLARFDLQISKAYARRCKKSPEELYALMEKEVFLSAEEALEWGFIDEITNLDEDPAPYVDSFTAQWCANAGLHLPESVIKNKTEESAKDESLISRIVSGIKSAFSNPNSKDMNTEPQTPQASLSSEEQPAPEQQPAQQPAQPAPEVENSIEEPQPVEQHPQVIDSGAQPGNKFRCNFTKSANDLFNSLP